MELVAKQRGSVLVLVSAEALAILQEVDANEADPPGAEARLRGALGSWPAESVWRPLPKRSAAGRSTSRARTRFSSRAPEPTCTCSPVDIARAAVAAALGQ